MENKTKCSRRKFKPVFLLLIPVILAAVGAIIMLLWNSVLTAVISVNVITFWQALGLLVLSRILFGSHSMRGRHRKPGFAMERFKDEYYKMSDEEKQRFKNEWRKRFEDQEK